MPPVTTVLVIEIKIKIKRKITVKESSFLEIVIFNYVGQTLPAALAKGILILIIT